MKNKERLKEIIKILKENDILNNKTPENIRQTLEKLGPTFIKIGQILSTRVDLIPNEYCQELSKLRTEVTPLPFEEILRILKQEYGAVNYIFKSISRNPIGSASIAQVHRAKLNTNEDVVIKIKRPNIENEITEDIELLKEASKTLHLNHFVKVIDIDEVIDELYKTTMNELDFTKEKENMLLFEKNNKNIITVTSPKVITELSTKNIIVMEYVKGIMISDVNKLDEYGYDRKIIAQELSQNYIKQALEDGVFHADPHQGNIYIQNDKIFFLDWGMVGTLNNTNRMLLTDCMKAIIKEDYEKVATLLINMSKQNGNLDKQKLINDIKAILSEYANISLDQIDIVKFISKMFIMLRENHLTLDHNITMLIRGISILEAVLQTLDPNINLISVLEQKVIDNEIKSFSITQTLKKVYRSTESLVNIPKEADKLLKQINSGNVKFKFELSDSQKHVDKIENLIHELILGFIDGCLIIAFSFTTDLNIKFILLILIILLSVWLVLKMIIDNSKSGY